MLKPIGNRVVVHKFGQSLSAKEKPQEGTVVAVGSGRTLENGTQVALEVKEGDRVVYAKFAGTEVQHGDNDYLILSESEILAVIE